MERIWRTGIVLAVLVIMLGCSEEPEAPVGTGDLPFEPLVRITAPEDGSHYSPGDTITFAGTVRDMEDAPTALAIQWRSDKDGRLDVTAADSLGNVGFGTRALSYNTHTVNLVVTDTDGNVGMDSVRIYNNVPSPVKILSLERSGNAASLLWSRSTIPDFACYRIFRSQPGLLRGVEKLVATIEAVDETTYVDSEVALGVLYAYYVSVFNAAGVSAASEDATIEISNINLRFGFPAADAAIHPAETYIFLTSKNEHALYRVDYEAGTTDTMVFDHMTESIEIYDTGAGLELYVALLVQDHSSYWWEEDQEGYIAIVDADFFNLVETMHIDTDPYDIVAGRDGYIYVPSGSGQWTDFKSYNRVTHQTGGTGHIRQRSEAKLHPTDNRIYTMNTDVSPRDIEVFVVSNGSFLDAYDSPYHGGPGFGHPFRICPTGEYLVTASGTIYTCSAAQEEDVVHLGSLGEGFGDVAFDPVGSVIYTCATSPQVNTYDYNTFVSGPTITTEGVGRFLFFRTDSLVAVVEPPAGGTYVTGIEMIPLY
jgi:hypothetical protein